MYIHTHMYMYIYIYIYMYNGNALSYVYGTTRSRTENWAQRSALTRWPPLLTRAVEAHSGLSRLPHIGIYGLLMDNL